MHNVLSATNLDGNFFKSKLKDIQLKQENYQALLGCRWEKFKLK